MSLKSFKTTLILNNKQATLASKHAGVARHAYNWGLATCFETIDNNQLLPSSIDLHKKLVAEVKSVYEWYYEVSKCAPQQALRNLHQAFMNWWKHQHCQKPKFKKKGIRDSFYLEGAIKISGNKIKLPIFGWITADEILPSVIPKNVTISKRASKWFISFKYELENKPTPKTSPIIGVDVGINSLATCSDGTVFANPKAYRKAKKRLARLQRALSRKQKGSNNRKRALGRLQKAHYRVANIRKDTLHKITTHLAKNHSEVVIEDLNVSGMLKNHRLASAIADCGFYEFVRQLEYKCEWYGSTLTRVDRFFPSSQLCSNCGHKQKMPLSQRVYQCGNCGTTLDRDLNASINIRNAFKNTPSSGEINACEEVKQLGSTAAKTSMKHEVNIKPKQLSLFDLLE
ncbi:RNA-guided endonuclease TnpB family protein [Gloeocapsa sp. PCC 73106]|uniref:RNA-guided endonuclease InsQ/TnpB family protein n=1 Tax=Gloeocapsa sp. PCC 73106 TaxID=102232 RepID=UPI0002AC5DCD|nr:RNA-guided endonuclease TnpB family protein [Gloeocapsa sp. PCC 73106]ELR98299.1 transposase, IS605 OrfB family, central region [Gloeocapsa sp. PCC 73106]